MTNFWKTRNRYLYSLICKHVYLDLIHHKPKKSQLNRIEGFLKILCLRETVFKLKELKRLLILNIFDLTDIHYVEKESLVIKLMVVLHNLYIFWLHKILSSYFQRF